VPTRMMVNIEEQPDALRRVLAGSMPIVALQSALAARTTRKIWLAGSGTSLYAAMIAAPIIEHALSIDAEAISSLELHDELNAPLFGRQTLLVGISQSGSSLVLVDAVRAARQRGALTVAVTAEPASPIATAAEFVIDAHTGPEEALAKTKGFSTTTLAASLLGPQLARPNSVSAVLAAFADVPSAAAEVIARGKAAVAGWVERLGRVTALYVVGAGAMHPAAREGGLKILEVAKLPVVATELEEMMHGPFNGVGPDTGIILLAAETSVPQRLPAFLKGVAAVNVPFLSIAANPRFAKSVEHAFDLVLPTLAEESVKPILATVPLQIFAEHFARQRGVAIDTARYPFLYPILGSKAIHLNA
jgi:fructoselysine-6-P-deglycase FrlB-like protein